jgi:hypothetical protein
LSTSKKSDERRWLSRSVDPDSTDAMSMATSTVESVGSPATCTVPSTAVNRPRILVSPKWRPTKPISACPGSIAQVPAAGNSTPPMVCVALIGDLLVLGVAVQLSLAISAGFIGH